MICPRCNSEIADNALICPKCGDWCAASAQKERVDALKSKTKTIVHDSFRSRLFQAMTILMTIVAAATALTCFNLTAGDGGVSFNFDFTVIIYVIAAVFCWQAGTSSDPRLAGHHLRRVSFFDAAYWIIMLVAAIILGLLSPLCFVLIGMGGGVIAEAWTEMEPELAELLSAEELEMVSDLFLNQAELLFGVIAFIFLIATAVLVWLCIIHFKRRRYLKTVGELIDFDQYNIEKAPPYISAIVYAGIGIFGTLTSLSTAIFTTGFSFISLAQALALDSYIILSAIWMTRLHKDELANNAEIENESAILNNLIYSSKIAYENQAKENAAENEVNE